MKTMLLNKKEEGVFKEAKDRFQKPLYSRENSKYRKGDPQCQLQKGVNLWQMLFELMPAAFEFLGSVKHFSSKNTTPKN